MTGATEAVPASPVGVAREASGAAREAPGVGPEARLLLGVSSVRRDDRLDELRSLLREGLDWSYVVQIAQTSRILALLCDGLEQVGLDHVPETARADLAACGAPIQFRNLAMLQELLGVLGDLDEQGVEALPYKGPVVAATLYGNLALRQFADLDIMVHKEDVWRAADLLIERGYTPRYTLAPRDRAHYLERDCEYHLVREDLGIQVEVHWEVLPTQHAFGFDIADFWKRLVPVTLGGRELRTFPPEDLLLLLCIHGGEKHRWMRLQMLCDVAHLLDRHRDLDWPRMLKRARGMGRERTLLLGPYIAWQLLDAPLPEEVVRQALADWQVDAQAALVQGRVFRPGRGLPRYTEWRRYVEAAGERSRARGLEPTLKPSFRRYLAAVLTPEWTDREALPLPRPLSFLYYLTRPVRLFRAHGMGLFRRI